MGKKQHVVLSFLSSARGKGRNDSDYTIEIGAENARPYDLLLMALGSCLYMTFEDIIKKKRLRYASVEIDISGEKRDEVPAFLQSCTVVFTVTGADRGPGFEKAFELACSYCSIYQTLAHVAEMKGKIEFS